MESGIVQEQITSADGTRIACFRGGSGRPLLLLTGALMDHTGWDRLRPLLEPHAEVWAIDRRGRGASGDTPPHDPQREVEDLMAVADHIGQPVDLLGHSSGAVLALQAVEAGLPVRRLALYEPPLQMPQSGVPDGATEGLLRQVAEGRYEEAVLDFVRMGLDPKATLDSMRTRVYWAAQVAMAPTIPYDLSIVSSYRFDQRRLAALAIPTLILYGDTSPSFMQSIARTLASTLPDCQSVALPGQGHIAMYTAPQLLAQELIAFFSAP